MDTKNKINLSPLPQQADDYSRYENSEFRWDRIIAAILVILLVIITFSYLFLSSDDDVNNTELKSKVLEISDINEMSKAEQQATSIDSPLPSNKASIASTAQQAAEIVKVMPPESGSKRSIGRAITKPIKLQKEQNVTTKLAETAILSAVPTVANKQMRPASVLIVNSAITRANLSLSIKEDEPGNALNHSIVMPEGGIIKVILFTEMNDIRGRTLFHEWYLNGKRQARVRIPINVRHQKSFSSKFINQQMLGQWQVKVIDENGEPYILADFEVISP